MSDKLTVIGVLDGIIEKPGGSGWTTIAVKANGKDFPVKMDTKLPALIDKARAAGTNEMAWTYSESDSGTPNPNRPGSNYMNRRFEGVDAVGSETPAGATSAAPAASSSTATTGKGGERGSIERQTIVKAAISVYPDGIVKSDADFFFLLAKLERFCAHGSDSALTGLDPDEIPF